MPGHLLDPEHTSPRALTWGWWRGAGGQRGAAGGGRGSGRRRPMPLEPSRLAPAVL